MTNIHYAKIGDVWKHLPLAEVLSIERPGRNWESHFAHDGELCMECARREGVL
jgi:hypothetical protein